MGDTGNDALSGGAAFVRDVQLNAVGICFICLSWLGDFKRVLVESRAADCFIAAPGGRDVSVRHNSFGLQ